MTRIIDFLLIIMKICSIYFFKIQYDHAIYEIVSAQKRCNEGKG